MSHPSGRLYFPPPPGQPGLPPPPPPLPPRNGAVAAGPNTNHQDGSRDAARPPPLPPRDGQPAYQTTLPQQALWSSYAAPPVPAAQPVSQPYPYPDQYPSAASAQPVHLTQQNQVSWTFNQTGTQVPLRAPETQADLRASADRNPLREQQPWYQDMLRRQDEELQNPEVQRILQQRQVDLAQHLERQHQEEQNHHYARPQSHATGVVANQGAQPAYQYQYGNPTAPAQTYVAHAYSETAQYPTLQQNPPFRSNVPQYEVVAWTNPGTSITGQMASTEQAKKSFGATKWVNKLNNLSTGLSKLQLQLSAAAAAHEPTTTTAAPSAPVILGSSHAYSETTIPTTAYPPVDIGPVHSALPVSQPLTNVPGVSPVQDGAAVLVQRDSSHIQGPPNLASQTYYVPTLLPQAPPLATVQISQRFTVPTHAEDVEQQEKAAHQDLDPDSWVRPVPRMTNAGPPNDIIFDCPGSRALDYEATWYFLPAVQDFLICTRCHERHFRGSSIAAQFHSARLSGKETDGSSDGVREGGNKCRFNTPRLTQDLVPRAKASGDIRPVEEYMTRRVNIKACPGTERVRASDGFKWFNVANVTTVDGRTLPEIYRNVLVCEACYEDQVLGSSFAAKFGPVTRVQPEDQLWPCDFGMTPFFGKAFRWFSQVEKQQQIHHHQVGNTDSTNQLGLADTNWLELANVTSPRWRLPACEGFRKTVDPASRRWFRARQLPELFLCEACHLDEIKFTSLEAHFEPADVTSKTGSAWMDAALGYATEGEFPPRVCQGKSRPILIALGIALRRRDAGILVGSVIGPTILRSPVCTDQGLEDATSLAKLMGGQWYRLLASGPRGDSGGSDDSNKFRICEACHACLARALGLERYWEAEDQDLGSGKRLVCGLHPGAPRGAEYLARLDEAIDMGVWATFETYVRVWIDIPPCPRNLLHNNDKEESRSGGRRKWYGWEDCLICAECYVKFCEPLAIRTAGATADGGRPQQRQQHGLDINEAAGKANDLLSFLPLQNQIIGAVGATGIMCCMYSPRMRELFRAVVEEKLGRSGGGDVTTTTTTITAETALLSHSRTRHAVHARTIPQLRAIREMREMAMLQSLHSGMLGLMYQGAGAMQTISGTAAADGGYLYGSGGGLGWHETANHATSAALFEQSRAQGVGLVAGTPGDMLAAKRLLEEWEAVE